MIIRKHSSIFLLGLVFFSLLTGCASTHVYKTIGLTETLPPTSIDQVKIIERNEPITDNFQTIGKVTVNCNTGISEGSAISKMRETASQLGADGIIDFHRGAGCQWRWDAGVHYNGLMVKWLPNDTPKKTLDKKFIVTRLPIINPGSPNEKIEFDNLMLYQMPMIDFPWGNDLTFKGYYVLPECENISNGIDSLSSNLCQEAQIFVKASIISKSKSLNVPMLIVHGPALTGLDHDAVLNVELIDRVSGNKLIEKQGEGSAFKPWITGIVESGDEQAAGEAIKQALESMPRVGDPIK